MTVTTTTSARHVLFRLEAPARLPDALVTTLRDEVVLAGWVRASGVLHDVVLRTVGGTSARTLSGALQVVALEGSVGLSQGDVTCSLRAVLARETDTGLETLAGEIVAARVDSLEVLVTAFDDVSEPTAASPAPAPAAAPAPAHEPEPEPAAAAPTAPDSPRPPSAPKPSPTFSAPATMPRPIAKPKATEEEDQPYPDAGDTVEHFAFGRCEVVKSDGDRLHLRLGKDGRIKEIALEMLRVTPLAPIDGGSGRHFKLDRKL